MRIRWLLVYEFFDVGVAIVVVVGGSVLGIRWIQAMCFLPFVGNPSLSASG